MSDAPTELVAATSAELLLLVEKKVRWLMTQSQSIAAVVSSLGHDNLETHLSKVPFIRGADLTAEQLRALGELGLHIAMVSDTMLCRRLARPSQPALGI